MARMMSGEPPDVFQCNVGYDMRQWVSPNGIDDRDSKLAPLDETFPWLWKAVPSKLLDYISYQGKPLVSRQRVYWRVRVWNGQISSDWSTKS